MLAPAMSAPISTETEISRSSPIRSASGPRLPPSNPTPKHQPSATVTTSSGVRATAWKAWGRIQRAATAATVPTKAMPAKVSRIGDSAGWAKLGCRARITMAHTSWKMSSPTQSRPLTLSSSRCSWMYLATSRVEEKAQATPR